MKSAIEHPPRGKSRLKFFPKLFPRAYADTTVFYNTLVLLGCAAIFIAVFFTGSLLTVLSVISAMFLTRNLPEAQIEMGWMAVLILSPAVVFLLDAAFCMLLLIRNIKRPRDGRLPREASDKGGKRG